MSQYFSGSVKLIGEFERAWSPTAVEVEVEFSGFHWVFPAVDRGPNGADAPEEKLVISTMKIDPSMEWARDSIEDALLEHLGQSKISDFYC